jgi:4a-hydroxytetrahydrobiopterin dehydratase
MARVGPEDVELAVALSAELRRVGATTLPPGSSRSTQALEIAIDAMDADSIRPFWQAVLAYAPGPAGDLVDPYGVGPSVWFQQMDAPRPQRNRIHLDVSVPHDEVRGRLDAAVAAGGRVVFDAEAPAFWVLADDEGNEACLCTWQGRDG